MLHGTMHESSKCSVLSLRVELPDSALALNRRSLSSNSSATPIEMETWKAHTMKAYEAYKAYKAYKDI